jgi:hypothetical protein
MKTGRAAGGLLALCAAAAGCARPGAARIEPGSGSATDVPRTSVTLERTACYGRCPVYTVRLSGDGTVAFHGERFTATSGDAAGKVPREWVAALVREMNAAGYWSLGESYAAGSAACPNSPTDLPSEIITLTAGGRSKRVEHYRACSGAPASIAAMASRIDQIAGTEKWIGPR